jgi:hypothetical protein
VAERLRTFLLVTLLAVVFWLFAEAESLGQYTGLTRIRFITGDSAERLVRPADGFDGSVTIDMTGTKAAVARASQALAGGIALEPGMTGLPTTEGRHSINLLQALQAHPTLREVGAQITSVRPQVVDVIVTELTTQQVPIDAALPGVEVVGGVKVTPERATVRLPKAAWELSRDTLRITARLSEAQVRGVPSSGAVRLDARLEPPESIVALPGFTMVESSAMLDFIVRSRAITERLTSVPVQVVLPPIEVGRWRVEIDEPDRFLEVQASGSTDRVERLRKKEDAVIAVVSLSSDDLAAMVQSRPVTLMVLRQGAMSVPADLELSAAKQTIALKIIREPEVPAKGPTP